MKIKKKDFIEESRPTRPAYRKDDDEKEDKEKSEHKCESCGQAAEQWEGNPDQVKRTDKEIKDKKLNQYKSNEIVEKAIELINEAYDEMKKTEDLTQQSRSSQELRGGKYGDVEHSNSNIGRGNTTGRYDSDHSDTANETSLEKLGTGGTQQQVRDRKGQLTGKADGSTSTGDVGAANFVYSDVAEAKKNEEISKRQGEKIGVGEKDTRRWQDRSDEDWDYHLGESVNTKEGKEAKRMLSEHQPPA